MDKIEKLGWFATALLIIAYVLLLFSIKLFLIVNFLASILLTVYSILRKVIPLVIVNAFISFIVLLKIFVIFFQ